MDFVPYHKIPRLNREIIITEKLDGTNAAVAIFTAEEVASSPGYTDVLAIDSVTGFHMYAQSRTRIIFPGKNMDNHGFAAWVKDNAEELFKLGHGHHFGEWWGKGIQRGYGLTEKKFSLFNASRWSADRPSCCDVVPTLYQGPFDQQSIDMAVLDLMAGGSKAAPGYMNPEGIIVFHTASSHLYKVTCLDDESPKGKTNGSL